MKLFYTTIFLLINFTCYSQISEEASAVFPVKNSKDILTLTIDIPNTKTTAHTNYYSRIIPTDINLITSGNTVKIKNGQIIILKVKLKYAQAVSLYYSDFEIAQGGKLFIYSSNRKHVLGAFTHKNNSDKGSFATGFIPGNEIILEYFVPNECKNPGKILINEIGFVPTNKSGLGSSDSCQMNVNCPKEIYWHDQKNAVVKWLARNKDGAWWCTGTIINNGRKDFKPYILSAEHNILDNDYLQPDLEYFRQFMFYFNYESSDCEVPNQDTILLKNSMIGCKLIAQTNSSGEISGSDFLLLELQNDIPEAYTPYYAGWSRENVTLDSAYCIHHPQGDLKKVSKSNFTESSTLYGTDFAYWKTNWQEIDLHTGTTELGSSGAPLFNSSGLIIGTLTGGNSSCIQPESYDYFGKFSSHWDKNGNTANRQLKAWLDPDNVGIISMTGSYRDGNSIQIVTQTNLNAKVFPIPFKNKLNVEVQTNKIQDLTLRIINISGRTVFYTTVENIKTELDLNNLPKGIYILSIEAENKQFRKKIIKL